MLKMMIFKVFSNKNGLRGGRGLWQKAAICDVLGLRMLKMMIWTLPNAMFWACVCWNWCFLQSFLVNMAGFIFSALADVEDDDFYIHILQSFPICVAFVSPPQKIVSGSVCKLPPKNKTMLALNLIQVMIVLVTTSLPRARARGWRPDVWNGPALVNEPNPRPGFTRKLSFRFHP